MSLLKRRLLMMSEEKKFSHNLKYYFMVGHESLNINNIRLVYGYPSDLVPNYDCMEHAIEALIDLSQGITLVDSYFTKEELKFIKDRIFHFHSASIGQSNYEFLRHKLEYMIENY